MDEFARYKIVSSDSLSDDERAQIEAHLKTDPFQNLPQIQHTPEQDEAFYDMGDAIHHFGMSQLGVNFADRITFPSQIHIFETRFYEDILIPQRGLPKNSRGFNSLYKSICVCEDADDSMLYGQINHEMLEAVTFKTAKVSRGVAGSLNILSRRGVILGNTDLNPLTEAILEITNYEIRAFYWNTQYLAGKSYSKDGGINVAYSTEVMVADELIKTIAANSGRAYIDVLRDLQKAIFAQDGDALEVIGSGLNEDISAFLVAWDGSDESSILLAEKLGLDNLKDMLKGLRRESNLLQGVRDHYTNDE